MNRPSPRFALPLAFAISALAACAAPTEDDAGAFRALEPGLAEQWVERAASEPPTMSFPIHEEDERCVDTGEHAVLAKDSPFGVHVTVTRLFDCGETTPGVVTEYETDYEDDPAAATPTRCHTDPPASEPSPEDPVPSPEDPPSDEPEDPPGWAPPASCEDGAVRTELAIVGIGTARNCRYATAMARWDARNRARCTGGPPTFDHDNRPEVLEIEAGEESCTVRVREAYDCGC